MNESKEKNEPSGLSGPRHTKAWIQILAAALGVIPIYSGLIILHLQSDGQLSMQGFILYLAVIAPLGIAV